jgi:hypothetical protein
MPSSGLRLMVYDRTCTGRLVGLSTAWHAGAVLYRGLDRLDGAYGATSWDDALAWLATFKAPRPIAEVQYWGHGQWGRVLVDRDVLDVHALALTHRLAARVAALKARLVPDGRALVWLRTCEAFGAEAGRELASRLADGLGARVAGHTFVIGALQSGLRGLRPGNTPDWSTSEGLAEGTPSAPVRAHESGLLLPRTISCFAGAVPEAWFT